MKRLTVLFLPQPGVDPVWQAEIEAAVGARHDLRIYDRTAPLEPQFRGVQVVIDTGGSVGTRAMYDTATGTKLWQILGTGLDHVDVAYLRTKGFAVANCPGQFSHVGLAECAMMFILMLARRYREAAANFDARVRYKPMGGELEGRVLGIVGLGASGRELARRARGFGMRLQAIDVRPIEPEVLAELAPEFVGTPADLDRVVRESDVLSLHLHLNPETRHTIDARRLSLMKPTAFLVNVARGALVDEAALYDALLAGRIGGAGLDVFAAEPPEPGLPVYRLPNVVVTPHIAGATDGTARRRAAAAAENVDRVAAGLEPLYRVDQ
jgi:phosphoglycerate dehydrogenase-like enzyme